VAASATSRSGTPLPRARGGHALSCLPYRFSLLLWWLCSRPPAVAAESAGGSRWSDSRLGWAPRSSPLRRRLRRRARVLGPLAEARRRERGARQTEPRAGSAFCWRQRSAAPFVGPSGGRPGRPSGDVRGQAARSAARRSRPFSLGRARRSRADPGWRRRRRPGDVVVASNHDLVNCSPRWCQEPVALETAYPSHTAGRHPVGQLDSIVQRRKRMSFVVVAFPQVTVLFEFPPNRGSRDEEGRRPELFEGFSAGECPVEIPRHVERSSPSAHRQHVGLPLGGAVRQSDRLAPLCQPTNPLLGASRAIGIPNSSDSTSESGRSTCASRSCCRTTGGIHRSWPPSFRACLVRRVLRGCLV